jgi:predicted unusual protein kinase regulating ubiquinone biosynthesis (AarF/ABC1/UbiB family)
MKQFEQVVVPKPYREFCTKEVLVMEFLSGIKLITGD